MRRIITIACLIAALGTPLAASAAPALPPRNVSDIITLLNTAPPDTEHIAKARELLATPVADTLPASQRIQQLTARSNAAVMLGQTDSMLADIRAAWSLAHNIHDNSVVQTRVSYLAAEVHAGNFKAALEAAENHVRHAPLAGSRLASLSFLAENKARHGDPAGAESDLTQAEVEFNRVYTSGRGWTTWGYGWEASIERARGGVALGRGKFADAERHFRKSTELREKDIPENADRLAKGIETVNQELSIGFFLMAKRALADTILLQGRLVEAEMLYREILDTGARAYGLASPMTLIYIEGLCRVLLEQGRIADARDLTRAALDVMLKQGMAPESRNVISNRQRLASAHVAARQWPEAMTQYAAIQAALAQDSELNSRLGQGDKDWALTLLRTGKVGDAEQMMNRLLADEQRRFGDDEQLLAESRGLLAMALAAGGNTADALTLFRKAVPALLSAQKDAAEEEAATTTRRLVTILEAYLDLLYRLHASGQTVAGLDIPAETFRIADVARGSAVQKALLASAARSATRDPRLAQLVRDEQDMSHRINTLQETLSRLASVPAAQRLDKIIADIRRDIPQLKNERKALREWINKDFPEYTNLISPQPLVPDEVRRLLQTGEALLATYVGENASFVWGIAKTGPVAFAASKLDLAAVNSRVAKIRKGLDLGNSSSLDSDLDLASAHSLYAEFVRPVMPALANTDHLLVVPHGSLGQIPFALLPTAPAKIGKEALAFESYSTVPWLIRERTITQLPSVSTLYALRQFAPQQTGQRQPLLGFGDPFFNARQAGDTTATQRTQLASRSIGLRASPTTRNANSATIADLARLPDTATELNEIALALKIDPKDTVHLGKAANETGVKTSKLADYRIVAFATHGLIPGDLNGLAQPALALSNPEVTGEKDADGLLTMEEILGLKMNADWVVLSACNTASADGSSAEAVSGLGRAFFYAGTRALLVTNWPVETVSARLLTTELFRKQAEQPTLSRAQALRSAMLTVMQGKSIDPATGKPEYSYAHPLFWAPYSLVGDGGTK
ncbi:MAG: CHAT domain-containing protein [Gammaproteobacteria bacterium]|nr:MAG: CHAT domain-containing protein [Gammaproteobacteria bacterium]